MAELAKGMAAASVPDKQRRHAQSTTVVKPAEGVARRSKLYTSDVNYVVSSTSLTISLTILAHLYYYAYYTYYNPNVLLTRVSLLLLACGQARPLTHLDLARPPF